MAEKKRSLTTILSFIAVVVAIIGIFSPYINENIINKRDITITIKSEISLLNDNDFFDDLILFYKDKEISNLSKTIFIIRNNGNKPFVKSDLVEPIKIILNDENKILHTEIIDSKPNNLNIDFYPIDSNLSISFDLLNPGEYAEFSIFYSGKYDSEISVESRVKNMSEITFVDSRDLEKEVNQKRRANWVTWFIGIFGSLILLVLLSDVKNIRIHREIRKKVKDIGFTEYIKQEGIDTKEKLIIFIDEKMGFLNSTKKKEINEMLMTQSRELFEILEKIRIELIGKGPVEKSLGFYISFSLISILYFIWFFFF